MARGTICLKKLLGTDVIDINTQEDCIHIVAYVPENEALADYVQRLKEQTSEHILEKFPNLKAKLDNYFWGEEYYTDSGDSTITIRESF